jgi:hypothetical protein
MRPVRRPTVVGQYAAQIAEWLREDPTLRTIEILRRVRRAGYRGGKSALYELVRRVRNRSADQAATLQQLILVARDRKHLYNFFKLVFEGNPTIQVVLDRRAVSQPAQSKPPEQERRQRNRRRASQTTESELRAVGWTIVRLRTVKP